MTDLNVATTLDVYEWLAGGDFRWRWACQTSDDPTATTGDPEDVSDVATVRMWLQQQVGKGETAPAPIAYTSDTGQAALDVSDPSQAWLVVTLADADAVADAIPIGRYDVLIAYDRAGGVKDDAARFILNRVQGPRPAP